MAILMLMSSMTLTGCSSFMTPEKEMDTYLQNLVDQNKIPSISVLVIKAGRTVYKKSFGKADIRSGSDATPTSNYRLASLTKMHTAMCAIILHDQGLLDYDAKVSDYLNDFPEYGKEITVRHLLRHTSGLKDYYGEPVKLLNRQFDAEQQLSDSDVYEILKKMDATYFIPGTSFAYSDSGYIVLGKIIEHISGMSLPEFMDRNIYKPAGMNRTLAYVKSAGIPIPERVYGCGSNGSKFIVNDQNYSSATLGDGGVYSSLDDLERWDSALYDDTIVSQASIADAYATPSDVGSVGYHNYRFGWFFKENKHGIIEQSHEGGTQGFSTYYLRQPKNHNALIVLSNSSYNETTQKLHRLVRRLYEFEQEF